MELMAVESRYTDDQKIAEGGMKEIFQCYDQMTKRTVAKGVIKVKHNYQLEKLVNEARITAQLEHPNIMPIYDIGLTADKEPFFIMKLIDGDDLQTIIAKEQLPLDQLLDIFLKVCDAIAYSHSRKIVHLDIKPANIQIGKYGEVLVCDWGLAKQLNQRSNESAIEDDQDRSQSLDGIIKGSIGYMAPEQTMKHFSPKTNKADIYSLGALLYTICNGTPPLQNLDIEDAIKRTQSGALEPVKETIAPSLEAVIKKAMTVNMDDRYHNAEALANEIRAFRGGYATSAENAGFVQLITLMLKRHKAISALVIVFLLTTTLVVSSFLYQLNQEKKAIELVNSELIEEQQKRQESSDKAAEFMLANSVHNYFQQHFNRVLSTAEQSVELNPKLSQAWIHLAYLYLGELSFDKALEALKNADGENKEWLISFADTMKKKSTNGFSNDDIFALYHELTKVTPQVKKQLNSHINYTVTNTFSLEQRIAYAKEDLIKQSSKHEFLFQETEEGIKLHIDQSSISRLDKIANLPINDLSLSNSRVSDLSPLGNMNIEALDISHSKVLSLKGLEKSKLYYLNIDRSRVQNLGHIKNNQIKHLVLGSNKIHFGSIINLEHLEELTIRQDLYHPKLIKQLKDKYPKLIINYIPK